MPILMLKLTFKLIPEKAPLLLQPFLKGIFDALNRRMTTPRLQIHADFVSARSSLAHRPNLQYVADRSAPKEVKIPLVRRRG